MLATLNKKVIGGSVALSSMVSAALSPLSVMADGNYIGTVNEEEAGIFFTNIGRFITGVLRFVVVIAALLVFTYLIWGGIEWITAAGDKGQTEKARNKITGAVLGLIILSASVAIFYLLLHFFGIHGFDGLFDLVKDVDVTG